MTNTTEVLLASEKFTQAFPRLIRVLKGDVLTAVVLQCINYRAHITKPDESGVVWVDLRVQEIADEIGISKSQAQRALNKLRSMSLLMEKQSDGYNNKKIWRIDIDGLNELQTRYEIASNSVRNRSVNKTNTHQPRYDIVLSTYIEEDIRTTKKDKNVTTQIAYAIEITQACNLLADLIQANGSKRPTVTANWLSDMERLHRLDDRTYEQITAAIEWCQADDFWRGNIMSPAKLRKQYDVLRLAATPKKAKESAVSRSLRYLNESFNPMDAFENDKAKEVEK